MLLQLLVIGYLLTFLFNVGKAWIVLSALSVMILAASWISLRTIPGHRVTLFGIALVSVFFGGGAVLAVVIFGVLDLDPWFAPHFVIPLAGMIFGGSMNSISLGGERLKVEMERGEPYLAARATALKTALIPITNSLYAVGLVSLPGMMTGQILSGVSPLVAVRYQIMVMCMLLAATGFSAILFLWLIRRRVENLFPAQPTKRKPVRKLPGADGGTQSLNNF